MEHMIEPYGLSCGHVGCYECLHAWFTRSTEDDNHRKAKVCPSCRAPIRARPNELYIIKELVQIAALANNESISQPPQRTGDVWEGVFRPGGEYGPIEDREDGVLRCGRCSDAEDEDEEEEEEEEEEEDEDEEVYADPADELERVSRLNLPFSIIGVSDSEHSSQRTESEEHDSDSDGNEHPRNSQNHNDENIWRGIRENEESESESDDFISDGGSVESRNRSGSRGLGAPVEYIHSDDEEEEEEEEASSTSSSSSSSRQSESESESEASSSSREVNPTRRHNAGVIELSDDDNSGDGIPTSIPPRSRRRAIISDDDDDE
ncbi:hypothetical protein E3Q11_03606 [Wallemia mellicola]|nr:hypothetical protein E3Q11_03606 [Wallemia mellicola]